MNRPLESAGLESGEHGGDAGSVAAAMGIDRSDLIDLSMSMNPVAPDVSAVVAGHLDRLQDYPNPERAEAALAAAMGIDRRHLVVTNGGAEAIALVARLHPAGAIMEPEFSLYRRHLGHVHDDGPRWRSNPSNPLGRLAEINAADPESHRGVWDEAFYPLTTGRWTDPALATTAAWRVGSLTKLWACPGLRIGYAIAPDVDAAQRLRAAQPRWSVGGLGLGVIESLLPMTDLAGWASQTRAAGAELASVIAGHGFEVESTDANWVLVGAPAGATAADLRRRLLAHGVVVRDCANFDMERVARVAVPRASEMAAVSQAFERVAQSVEP